MQENLARGLGVVSRAVSSRSTLPVLANVLLRTEDAGLKLTATNLEIGITCWVPGRIETDGALTVPARLMADVVASLDAAERVDLEVAVRTNSLRLGCGATVANIKGIDAQEFPIMPEPEPDDERLPIPVDILRETIGRVAIAAARDDSRPILTGVSITYENGLLTMAAADGFRLSVRELPLEAEFYDSFSLVVPARTLTELARISAEEEQFVQLILPQERSQVLFHMTNVDVVTQVIDGSFPDYRQIIPRDVPTRTIVDTADFLQACKRADIFAREANHTVRLNIQPQEGMAGVMKISAESSETGSNEGVIDASIEGEGVEIAFNVRYLIEVLNVIQQDRVVIGTSRADKPGVIRPVGDDTFTYVIMPMHIGR
jgi:DNA polymerase-3 subunit beta